MAILASPQMQLLFFLLVDWRGFKCTAAAERAFPRELNGEKSVLLIQTCKDCKVLSIKVFWAKIIKNEEMSALLIQKIIVHNSKY